MITIVFGKPGMGKTAYLTADAVEYMKPSQAKHDLLRSCYSQVAGLNASGAGFELPEQAPVYSNYPITVRRGTLPPVSSYYIDGFRLGFTNDDLRTFSVLPGARIYLSEAQRYYNSRRSKDLPDWVSRFYEEHRHFGLEIFLDVQRPGLIDANIREICGSLVEIVGLQHKTGAVGNIQSSVFYLRRFEDWKFADRYITSGEKCYTEEKRVFTGNVFSHYQSRSYFNQFVPGASENFSTLTHADLTGGDAVEAAEIARDFYPQSAPDGFYGRQRKDKPVKAQYQTKGDDSIVPRSE